MADSEPNPPFTDEQLRGDDVTKKDLATFLQANASSAFLKERKLKGALKSVVKTSTRDHLVKSYKELFETKAFRNEAEEAAAAAAAKAAAEGDASVAAVTEKTKKLEVKEEDEGPPKYSKRVMKKGDKVNFPKKGDTVACFYSGRFDNGEVFDQNMEPTKKVKRPQPLKFKVGMGKVIRGWDEGLLTMSVGEKSEFVIESEWAYGKKGLEGRVPPDSRLTFIVELVSID